jgi:UPF0755 protein
MKKKILYFTGGLALSVILAGLVMYKSLSGLKINTEEKGVNIYIPTGSSYSQVLDSLNTRIKIENQKIFNWMASKKKYPSQVKAGKYHLSNGMSYNEVINLLRSGRQTPVRVTFSIIRSLNELSGRVGKQIEADSAGIMEFLNEPANYSDDGFTRETVIAAFIPNTYEFFWNTDEKGFYNRMLKEYRKFWNDDRLAKADEKGLTPVEVAILASIIDDEVLKADEKPRIAGVYLNRLERGIPLQACPTIKFAMNDFTITRVLNKYLQIDSPYNTYKYKGFPPGPVGCPTVQGIDAVLNAEEHDYLYFAAKADFSGSHNFSRTLTEHNRYAAIYQRELNKRKIFR